MVSILVVLNGGLVQTVVSDTDGVEVRILDFDRGDEPRDDTASFLWDNRDVLRPTVTTFEGEGRPGDACHTYALQRDRYPYTPKG